MKIAMVARDLDWGIGSHTLHLARALRSQGMEVDLYVGRGNLETNLIPLRLRRKYDLVHIQGSPFGAFKNDSTPRVVTVHTTLIREWEFEKRLEFFLGKFFEVRTFNRSDRIIIVNEILRHELEAAYEVSPDKIVFIPNAVDVSEFDKHPEGSKMSFVMGCGRNVRRKDFPTLIRACERSGVPLKLFHGEASRTELINAYRNASVFVCPSLYETGPITIMEAMASKCPVICSDIPAVRDLVTDGETGLLFRSGDVEDLASAIEYLMFHPDLRRWLAKNAYEHVRAAYNWADAVEKTIQTYEGLL